MTMRNSLVWFRRDLRLDDHAALHHALLSRRRVVGVFVFDTDLLDGLPAGARILDAGCGSGRDAKAFAALGHRVTAFDASPELAALAQPAVP